MGGVNYCKVISVLFFCANSFISFCLGDDIAQNKKSRDRCAPCIVFVLCCTQSNIVVHGLYVVTGACNSS